MTKIFKGILPALITPLEADRKTVNEKTARDLIEYQLSLGADGFYILGSTGEGLLLEEEERMRMCEITVSQVAGRKPVICHVADMNFDRAVRLAKHAESVGADALSAVPPLFFDYLNDDIFDYYKRLAESTSLPFIVYNHVAANGGMSAELVAKLFEVDNITGVKWTINNYHQLMRLKDMTHGEMNLINGPDTTLVAGLSAGADAGIGTTYNVMLPLYLGIYRAFENGDMKEALRLQQKANKVTVAMCRYAGITATKAMCTMLGFPSGNPAYPLTPITEAFLETLEQDLAEAGWERA